MTAYSVNITSPADTVLTDFSAYLRYWAEVRSDHLAYAFLKQGELIDSLTFLQLDLQVRRFAGFLQEFCRSGDRVLILLSPGLDYITSFLACLYAGRVAVTGYAPSVEKNTARLRSILVDAAPTIVLHALEDREKIIKLLADAGSEARAVCVEEAKGSHEYSWCSPQICSDTLAFLQYTSGSTSQPKGVMVSHGNLIHNSQSIYRLFKHSFDSRVVSWLPPYHDMGLIGGILQPLFGGFSSYLMSPTDFLQRPFRWLQAISKYYGTSSGGPNFAYQYCVDKVKPEQLEGVDISSWEVAFNGAENVNNNTLKLFSEKFSSYGFRSNSFFPCYGLAEATLLVTGSDASNGFVSAAYDPEALKNNTATPSENSNARVLVSSGRSLPDQYLRIVSPDTQCLCGEREAGEIWISGPSIAQGYWMRPEDTEDMFHARILENEDRHYFRTGDVGYLDGEELFVVGRLKDLIILKGANYHPADIEHALLARRLGGGMSGVAAFSLLIGDEEKLAVAHELNGKTSEVGLLPRIVEDMRECIADEFRISPHAIFLVKNGSLPRTSSGKIRRQQCRTELGDWLKTIADPSGDQNMLSTGGLGQYVLTTSIVGKPLNYFRTAPVA